MVNRRITILIGLAAMLAAAPAHAGEKKLSNGMRINTDSKPVGVGLNRFVREGTRAASAPDPRSAPAARSNYRSGGHARGSAKSGRNRHSSRAGVHVSTGYRYNGVRVGFGLGYNSRCGSGWGLSYGYSAPLWYNRYPSYYTRYPSTVHVVNPAYYEPDVVYGWQPNEQRGFTPQERVAQEFPYAASATTQTDAGDALDQGWARLAAGRLGEAAQLFAGDAEADKTDIGAWVGFSMALASQDDLRQAAWAMRQALERNGGAVDSLPDNAALRLRARSLVDRYMTIVAMDGDNADALLMVGAFASMAGNDQLAYDSARASNEAEPGPASKNLLDRLAPPAPVAPEPISDTPTEPDAG